MCIFIISHNWLTEEALHFLGTFISFESVLILVVTIFFLVLLRDFEFDIYIFFIF